MKPIGWRAGIRWRLTIGSRPEGTTLELYGEDSLSVLKGVFSVLLTPFLEDGGLDPESMGRVIDLFIGGGVNGLTALGVTGEVARLTDRERQSVLETVMQHVNGRVAVVAGTTAEG